MDTNRYSHPAFAKAKTGQSSSYKVNSGRAAAKLDGGAPKSWHKYAPNFRTSPLKLEKHLESGSVVENVEGGRLTGDGEVQNAAIASLVLKKLVLPTIEDKKVGSSIFKGKRFSTVSPPPVQVQDSLPIKKTAGKSLVIYTDGSCSKNGADNARAGSGVWFGCNDPRNIAVRLPGAKQTSQRAEQYAVILALDAAPMDVRVTIKSDSKYVIKGMTEWMPNWIAKKEFEGRDNVDLWKRLLAQSEARSELGVNWVWVKAHSGIEGNEGADRLADAGAKKRIVQS